MFDEKENDSLERLNDWFWLNSSENGNKKVWVKRCEFFLCKKDESLEKLEERFDDIIDKLKIFEVKKSDAEKISMFADALPAEWNEFLNKLKKDSRFLKLHPKDFIRELKNHSYENYKKKKNLINETKKNIDEMDLDVIFEINERIRVCLAAKHFLKYDIKRGCYIDENMNPLNFFNVFHAGTFRKESIKKESSSETVCSKCDKSEADNVKLLKNVESLTLENEKLKENEKEFENKIKSSENENLWIKLENKNFKKRKKNFKIK
ncbi:hypothetical protein Hanom_Chr16g01439621 [Helianthus anomalus]